MSKNQMSIASTNQFLWVFKNEGEIILYRTFFQEIVAFCMNFFALSTINTTVFQMVFYYNFYSLQNNFLPYG